MQQLHVQRFNVQSLAKLYCMFQFKATATVTNDMEFFCFIQKERSGLVTPT